MEPGPKLNATDFSGLCLRETCFLNSSVCIKPTVENNADLRNGHWREQRWSPDFLDSSVSRVLEYSSILTERALTWAKMRVTWFSGLLRVQEEWIDEGAAGQALEPSQHSPLLVHPASKTTTKCLKGLGHETEFKYFDKKVDNSPSKEEPLLIFELWRWASYELSSLPLSKLLRWKLMEEITFFGACCQITWRPSLFPFGSLDEPNLIF